MKIIYNVPISVVVDVVGISDARPIVVCGKKIWTCNTKANLNFSQFKKN